MSSSETESDTISDNSSDTESVLSATMDADPIQKICGNNTGLWANLLQPTDPPLNAATNPYLKWHIQHPTLLTEELAINRFGTDIAVNPVAEGLHNPNPDLYNDNQAPLFCPNLPDLQTMSDHLVADIGAVVLARPYPYRNPQVSTGFAIAEVLQALIISHAMRPSIRVLTNPDLTGGANGCRPMLSWEAFQANLTSLHVYKLLMGHTVAPGNQLPSIDALSRSREHAAMYQSVGVHVLKWCVNAVPPKSDIGATIASLRNKQLNNSRRIFNNKTIVGMWSNKKILQEMDRIDGVHHGGVQNNLEPSMIKGMFYPQALQVIMLVPKVYGKFAGTPAAVVLHDTEKVKALWDNLLSCRTVQN